ncbi:hypothetical protein BKA67DRAFT_684429 [Truncatella angustata]|uniref:non-specific serine/threonine protein kinase n=1 Tax=Truncatella angustata TaxID=152316 RepID=A0A9P8UA38_9PEZI|nr:uncharacterized protein BKA67DRAFT_684429 [Truncatella angustata]KAH6646969.1 hypothetical protein BKA67DRAFT_684429 [Truncatella angustata]
MEDRDPEKRISQISTSSGASSGKRKTHIGPWQLGKTLGKGSAGRVRLARHHATREQVAVKILPKHGHTMTQAGSLAAIDDWDRRQPEFASEKRMPLSIEREVAILKLIDHPNIMKLYDIWENRSEIYLVLEYVERGDLFDYINCNGTIPEPETIYYFRQILSALDYCHSFNICHRDLKPENILLTTTGQVKIADFGMAAIQQSPSHKLKTACGSPHYAAPELVDRKQNGYSGATVDVWSCGVILYACLCACLPFDDADMGRLLAKARKAIYPEPRHLSPGVKSLLRKILKPNPSQRITISQIWEDPLIVSYDYIDELNGKRHDDNLDDIRKYGRSTRVAPQDIDMQTLRQLQSMWHMFTEKQLASKLVDNESNDQKLFYWLLYNYREKRLENYAGDITHSPSDYHLLRPANWTKKFTTLEFPARYGRIPSRFTVISNVATDDAALETATDAGTIHSYDPYKSSRIMDGPAASHAKITVHRNGSMVRSSTRASNVHRMKSGSVRSNSTYSRRGGRGHHIAASAGLISSRRSLTSINSANSTPHKRPISRPRRGVNFNHTRGKSFGHGRNGFKRGPASIAGDDTTFNRDHASPTGPKRQYRASSARTGTQSMVLPGSKNPHSYWNDELRLFSHSIAKDCDEAFSSSLLLPESVMNFTHDTKSLFSSMATPTLAGSTSNEAKHETFRWDNRPLPLAPPPTDSVLHEIMMAKKRTAQRGTLKDESPGHVDRMMEHLDKLTPAGHSKDNESLRSVSAPIFSQYSTQWGKDTIPLPSILEGQRESSIGETSRQRIVSAPVGDTPVAQSTPRFAFEGHGLDYLARQEETIRMVMSPSNQQGPVEVPAPLNIRKKKPPRAISAYPQPRQEMSLRQQYAFDEIREPIPEEPSTPAPDARPGAVRKKSSWFNRTSKDKNDVFGSSGGYSADQTENTPQTDSTISTAPKISPAKKRSFSLAFWRNSKRQDDMKLSLADIDFDDDTSPEPVRMFSHPARPPHNGTWKDNVAKRNIEPQQNWLARLFRVKPATQHLCFNISRRRTRQEIAILLKEWRRYGIRDVQVDKDRNIVFGRVGQKNYLNMKEVSFAAEIMTVIEHGKRNPLTIVRFTQERGAASSFHKVVDTMHTIFSVRNLLVVDKRKVKMMIKTLDSR